MSDPAPAIVATAAILLGLAAVSAGAEPTGEPLAPYKLLARKMASGKPVTVAYIGGSITVGGCTHPRKGVAPDGRKYDYSDYDLTRHSWRPLSFAWLRAHYEKRPGQFKMIHAGIGATTSELAGYRIARDVLVHRPDLLFVAFAVNDVGAAPLTSKDPAADGSVYRTLKSVIDQARAANPDVAIFLPIGSMRDHDTDPSVWKRNLDASRRHYRRVAAGYRIPFVDITTAYYDEPLPEGVRRDRLFDGPKTSGNRVHPSPDGHKAYAAAVTRTLKGLLDTGTFAFGQAPPLPKVRPYPIRPRILTARELPAADGWEVRTNAESVKSTPVHAGRDALFATRPGVRLRVPFRGTAVALWWEWVFSPKPMPLGKVEVRLDGKTVGIYANPANRRRGEKPLARYSRIATGLDPDRQHVLEVIVPEDQPLQAGQTLRLALHGICIDAGK